MPGASRSITIDAPVSRVFAVITAYEQYPQFLSEVKTIRTANRRGNEVEVHYEADVVKRIRYTLRTRELPPDRLEWSLVEGEFMRANQGHWSLVDLGGGRTQATYTIEVTLGPLVPKSVVNVLVDSQLPKLLEAFKKRAESATAV